MTPNATETERGPYLTRATVAGNRLSDLINALRRFDPDTRIRVRYVEREGEQIRLDGVEVVIEDGYGEHDFFPDQEALL